MSKSNKKQALEAQIEALTGNIKAAEELEELTLACYVRRRLRPCWKARWTHTWDGAQQRQ